MRACRKAKQALKSVYGFLFRDGYMLERRRVKACAAMTEALIPGGGVRGIRLPRIRESQGRHLRHLGDRFRPSVELSVVDAPRA